MWYLCGAGGLCTPLGTEILSRRCSTSSLADPKIIVNLIIYILCTFSWSSSPTATLRLRYIKATDCILPHKVASGGITAQGLARSMPRSIAQTETTAAYLFWILSVSVRSLSRECLHSDGSSKESKTPLPTQQTRSSILRLLEGS